VDGIIVENFGDAPFYPDAVPAETIAAMAVITAEVVRAVGVPVGVNVLRNDAAAALAVASASGARFVRVNVHTGAMITDQGWITGRAHETLRLRARIAPTVAIAADVLVKHAVPPAGLEAARAAEDAWSRGLADVLIVSGAATGKPTDVERIRAVKAAVPEATVWAGSGVDADNIAAVLAVADGAIIGSASELSAGPTASAPARPRAASPHLPASLLAPVRPLSGCGNRIPGTRTRRRRRVRVRRSATSSGEVACAWRPDWHGAWLVHVLREAIRGGEREGAATRGHPTRTRQEAE